MMDDSCSDVSADEALLLLKVDSSGYEDCVNDFPSGMETPEEWTSYDYDKMEEHLHVSQTMTLLLGARLAFFVSPSYSDFTAKPLPGFLSITLRRDESNSLGLHYGWDDCEGYCIYAVTKDGAVEAWNKQCTTAFRQILPGDRLVSVNGETSFRGIRNEVDNNVLYRLQIQKTSQALEFVDYFKVVTPAHGYEEALDMPFVPDFPYKPVRDHFGKSLESSYSTAVQSVPPGLITHFTWKVDISKLLIGATSIRNVHQLDCGEFVFAMYSKQCTVKRYGLPVNSSNGRGILQVEHRSKFMGRCKITVNFPDQDGKTTVSVYHNFHKDKICRVPHLFNFASATKCTDMKLAVGFEIWYGIEKR